MNIDDDVLGKIIDEKIQSYSREGDPGPGILNSLLQVNQSYVDYKVFQIAINGDLSGQNIQHLIG